MIKLKLIYLSLATLVLVLSACGNNDAPDAKAEGYGAPMAPKKPAAADASKAVDNSALKSKVGGAEPGEGN